MSRLTATTCLIALLALVVGLPLAGCGNDSGGGKEDAGATQEPPSKAEAIGVLRTLFAAMESKSWDEAAKYLNFGPKPPTDVAAALQRLLKQEEISAAGIDVLEQRGTFGTGAGALEGRVGKQAERAGIDPANSFGLALENAEVIGYRDAGGIKIIRLNNVGKLR